MKLSLLLLVAAAFTEAQRRSRATSAKTILSSTEAGDELTSLADTALNTAAQATKSVNSSTANSDSSDDSGSESDAKSSSGSCPAVWKTISTQLSAMFAGCNDDARAAIRSVFHDCFPSGGCDGSLAIPQELARKDNRGLVSYVNKVKALANAHKVTVADMISFAGSHAVATCPGGPTVQTYVGRKDATQPAPDGQLPQATDTGDAALSHFQARGFSAQDLAALIGAHTTSRQFVTDPAKAGTAQDTTPSTWDITYYQQTIAHKAPFSFQSDLSLAKQSSVGPIMKQFSKSKSSWDGSFAPAMAKMERLDTPSNLVDCTSALPKSRGRRHVKSAHHNDQVHHHSH